jgi:hypothetical protein
MTETSLKDYLKTLNALRDQQLGEMDLDKLLETIGCGEDFDKLVRDVATEEVASIVPEDRLGYLHEWLRFSQSDSALARMRWSFLAERAKKDKTVKSRDEFTLCLWKRVSPAKDTESFGDKFKEYVERTWCDWPYYEKHFFGWFLSRFDLASARAVRTGSRWAGWLDPLLAFTMLALCGLLGSRLFTFKLGFVASLLLLAAILVLGWAWNRLPQRPPIDALVHSLVPRLGAAVGIGYLFLASAQQIVKALANLERNPWFFWTGTVTLLAAAFLYVALHISRRVHPQLPIPHLLLRSGSVLSLAVTYTLAELLLAGPVLFSNHFLCDDPASAACNPHRQLGRLALCAAIALNLGVILQLAWDEKPLTEPL